MRGSWGTVMISLRLQYPDSPPAHGSQQSRAARHQHFLWRSVEDWFSVWRVRTVRGCRRIGRHQTDGVGYSQMTDGNRLPSSASQLGHSITVLTQCWRCRALRKNQLSLRISKCCPAKLWWMHWQWLWRKIKQSNLRMYYSRMFINKNCIFMFNSNKF